MCNSFNKKFIDEARKRLDTSDRKDDNHLFYIKKAVELAENGVRNDEGGPFGCVIVKQGKIIGEGNNRVTSNNDPTAHAEIIAIRDACEHLGSHQLTGCTVYCSCEPCPMCLGALYWARPDRVFFAGTKEDAAKSGFDDAFIYREIELAYDKRSIPFSALGRKQALNAFKTWDDKEDKIEY